jgi:hypothetical protein
MTTLIYPPEWWLTIPQICEALQVTPQELADWATNGFAPVPEMGPDGIGRVHRADYQAWLDSLPEDDPGMEDEAR